MRRWILLSGLLCLLPVLTAQTGRSQRDDVAPFVDTAAEWQPRVEAAQRFPVEPRFVGLKGPVRRVCERPVPASRSEPRRVEVYDKQGRLTDAEYYYRVHITYTDHGRTVNTNSPMWRWRRTYDAADRPLSEVGQFVYGGKWVVQERYTHEYDSSGREIASTAWTFSPGERTGLQRWISSSTRRFVGGRVVEQTLDCGQGKQTTSYQYDNQRRVSLVATRDARGGAVSETRYAYTPDGRPSSEITTDGTMHRESAALYNYKEGRLVERDQYAWRSTALSADGKQTETTSPDREQRGDSPLFLRTVYTYDARGQLARVDFLDAAGKPAYQVSPSMAYVSGSYPVTLYAYATFADVGGRQRFTLHQADGAVVESPFPRQPVVKPHKTRVAQPAPHVSYTYDSHGNWTKESYGRVVTVRDISYY